MATTIVHDRDNPARSLVVNADGSINATVSSVTGAAADGAAVSGNPVLVAGQDGTNTQSILTDTSGRQVVVGAAIHDDPIAGAPVRLGGRARTSATTSAAHDDTVDWMFSVQGVPAIVTGTTPADDVPNASSMGLLTGHSGSVDKYLGVFPFVFDGTEHDQLRGDKTGGIWAQGPAAQGATAVGNPVRDGGVYLSNANQLAVTTGQVAGLQTDPAGNLRTAPQRPTATDIVVGYLQHTSTTGAATLLTVAAGRTWVGEVHISVAGSKAAAATGNGLVSAVIATAGTNVVPAAGTQFVVSARIGANAATGTVGTEGNNSGVIKMTIVAPAGNAVTLTLASTLTNVSEGAVDVSAIGIQQ